MTYETGNISTPESEPSPKEKFQRTIYAHESADAETIQYWRTASTEEHARALIDVLDVAGVIIDSKIAMPEPLQESVEL